ISFRFCCEFLVLARERLPIRAGPQPLQDVDFVSVRSTKAPRFTSLHTTENARRSFFGRNSEKLLKPGNFLIESRPLYTGPDARAAGNRRTDSGRVHAGNTHGRSRKFMPQAFRKSPHGKLAGGISRLACRSDQPENARNVHDVR